jgi:hypothetical protein
MLGFIHKNSYAVPLARVLPGRIANGFDRGLCPSSRHARDPP